jgi:DNA-binding MarR family transcriptional regulator
MVLIWLREKLKTRENLGFLLAKAAQRWNELLYESFCKANFDEVSPAFGSILLPLFEVDGLQIGELGRKARLSKQAMTTMIKLMEQKGLVERKQDSNDRRAFRIYLTERSHKFKEVAETVLSDMDKLVRASLTSDQLSDLKDCLKNLMELQR